MFYEMKNFYKIYDAALRNIEPKDESYEIENEK